MFDLFAELTGLTAELRELRSVHLRICEALERLSPPLAANSGEGAAAGGGGASGAGDKEQQQFFHMAESPSEYQERMDAEAAFASSLGVAQWSPAFQKSIMEIRAELMNPRRVQDEETGQWSDAPALTEDEANEAIRKGFQLAKAAANERSGERIR